MMQDRAAFVGAVDWRASPPRLQLEVDADLQASGHVSVHHGRDISVLVFGGIANDADVARDFGLAPGDWHDDATLIARVWPGAADRCLAALAGDYALVVWEAPAARLSLVRNQVGTRALFHVTRADSCVFAADIAPLQVRAGLAVEPDPQALADYLSARDRPGEATLARGVMRVLPAHCLQVEAGRQSARRYWHPERIRTRHRLGHEQAVTELRELLATVTAQSVSGFDRLGLHVSGGLDSSAVAAHALHAVSALPREQHRGYVWQALPEPGADAGIDQRTPPLVAAHLGLSLRWMGMTREAMLASLSRDMLRHPVTTTLMHEYHVIAAAADDGCQLLLSGWGGDEFVSGHGQHVGYWRRWLGDHLRGRARARAAARPGYASATLRQRMSPPWRLEGSTPRRIMLQALASGHLGERAEAWSAFAALRGLQHAYPLLDRRVIEFALALPARLLMPGRRLMRDALAGLVPDAVRLDTNKRDLTRVAHTDVLSREIRQAGMPAFSPARCQHVDMALFAEAWSAESPAQSGKFLRAWNFLAGDTTFSLSR